MVLARVVIHVLARVLPHVLARVLLHVLARVIIHVHDYYSKTCLPDCSPPDDPARFLAAVGRLKPSSIQTFNIKIDKKFIVKN